MSRNYPKRNNPFADDEDERPVTTGRGRYSSSRTVTTSSAVRPSQTSHHGGYGGATGGVGWNDEGDDDWERPKSRYEQLQDQKQNSINNQKESMQRAIASIYESERMGVATAEELVHQGEQLDNIERKTDSINQTLTTSQKHLNNIKSIFGGFKNWWNKDKKVEEEPKPEAGGAKSERLRQALEQDRPQLKQSTRAEDHPALRLRNDTSGFYEDRSPEYTSGGANDPFRETQEQQYKSTSMAEYEKQFNENLDVMSGGMARLKGLAVGLGDEIDRQNEQIGRIDSKVDKTGTVLEGQNKQMRKILYE